MHVAMHLLLQATATWRSAGIPRSDSDSLPGVEGLGSAGDEGFSPSFGAQVRGCLAWPAAPCTASCTASCEGISPPLPLPSLPPPPPRQTLGRPP
jgi:hypothetical protein